MTRTLEILAVLTVRNGEPYVCRCLEHVLGQVVDVIVVDNDSTDRTRALAERYVGDGVRSVERLPFCGRLDLQARLQHKRQIMRRSKADWFIHLDVDEFLQAPRPFRTLREGIEDADRRGYNAINFDEFTFAPTSEDEDHEGEDFVATMTKYYFFEPSRRRLIRAFKPSVEEQGFESSGGHRIEHPDLSIFPQHFILRHYIGLSRRHLARQYLSRVHSGHGVRHRGWGRERAATRPSDIVLPDAAKMKTLRADGAWDRSEPWREHPFFAYRTVGRLPASEPTERRSSHPTPISRGEPIPVLVGACESAIGLVRAMLDRHRSLAIPPVTGLLSRFADQPDWTDPEAFARSLIDWDGWSAFGIDPAELRSVLGRIERFQLSDGIRAFYRLYAEGRGKSRWGDEIRPADVQMETVATKLPEARFVHIIRDGRDAAVSRRRRGIDDGQGIEEMAAEWTWLTREIRQQAYWVSSYYEIRYEELVREPASTAGAVCEFLELPFDRSMLSGRAADPESLADPDRPDGAMTDEQRRTFEAVARDLLRDLGYWD